MLNSPDLHQLFGFVDLVHEELMINSQLVRQQYPGELPAPRCSGHIYPRFVPVVTPSCETSSTLSVHLEISRGSRYIADALRRCLIRYLTFSLRIFFISPSHPPPSQRDSLQRPKRHALPGPASRIRPPTLPSQLTC